jgi:tetratricopeptide (TPR) repeat protein
MKSADRYLETGQYDEAVKILEAELPAVRASGDQTELLNTLCKLGISYYEARRNGEARAVFEEGLSLARKTNDPQLGRFAHELSMVRMNEGKLDEGIELCKEALELDLAAGGEGAMEMHTLSILYQEAGRFSEAMEVLGLVREACEARQDLEGLGKCLNEMGMTCIGSGDLPAAVKYMVDSIELKHRIHNVRGIQHTSGVLEKILMSSPQLMVDPGVRAEMQRLRSILA